MKLSAPVYRLKRDARRLSRAENIPLHAALDRIAAGEGFASWSLLPANVRGVARGRLFANYARRPGSRRRPAGPRQDPVEPRARGRGHEITAIGACSSRWNIRDRTSLDRFRAIGADRDALRRPVRIRQRRRHQRRLHRRAAGCRASGTLAVIDYLQLLDQKRENPELMTQVRTLKAFARKRG